MAYNTNKFQDKWQKGLNKSGHYSRLIVMIIWNIFRNSLFCQLYKILVIFFVELHKLIIIFPRQFSINICLDRIFNTHLQGRFQPISLLNCLAKKFKNSLRSPYLQRRAVSPFFHLYNTYNIKHVFFKRLVDPVYLVYFSPGRQHVIY